MRTRPTARPAKSSSKKAAVSSRPARKVALKPATGRVVPVKAKSLQAKRAPTRRPAALKRDLEKAAKNKRVVARNSPKRPGPSTKVSGVRKAVTQAVSREVRTVRPRPVAIPPALPKAAHRPQQPFVAKPAVVEAPPGCQHHWQIASPNGPTSIGTCKLCGEQREFRNSIPGGGWEREASEARKARAAAARAQAVAAAQAGRARA
ncbi:MAG: hypothetical protein HY678_04210 [Chloroflexi bacterium]|nr:hypothetical protein [Chloroflexota bacterium]